MKLKGIAVALVGLFGGWLVVRAPSLVVASLGAILLAILPPSVILAAGVVTSGAQLQAAIVGPLFVADLLLIGFVARSVVSRRPEYAHLWPVVAPLGLFLGWAFFATWVNGAPITPLMRVSLYAALMVAIAWYGVNERLLYAVILGAALWNIGGGMLAGQERLVGTFVGDPAQMGALILAAGVPLLTGDLRFPGWRLAGAGLLAGVWLTQTRSVWFATSLVLLVWLLRRRLGHYRTLALFVASVAIGLQFVGMVTERFGLSAESGAYRLSSILNGVESGFQSPWLGTGWATVDSVQVAGVVPYNLFVNVFASVGIPALVGLVAFLWILFRRLVREFRAPFLFLLAVMGMSLTEMTFYAGSLLTVLFFTYAGIGLRSAQREGLRADGVDGVGRGAPEVVHGGAGSRGDLFR